VAEVTAGLSPPQRSIETSKAGKSVGILQVPRMGERASRSDGDYEFQCSLCGTPRVSLRLRSFSARSSRHCRVRASYPGTRLTARLSQRCCASRHAGDPRPEAMSRLASADASAVSAGSLSRAALVVSEGLRELQARPALAERLVRLVRQAPRGFPELRGHGARRVSRAKSVSVARRVPPARSAGRGRQVREALRAHRE
jgi:hypothetical protein